jgi:hypothetical protein
MEEIKKDIRKEIEEILYSHINDKFKYFDWRDATTEILQLISDNYVLKGKPRKIVHDDMRRCNECNNLLSVIEKETCEDCLCPK